MPNEDFFGPVDLATLLTSLKGSVPATFGAYHKDLNAGEDEALRAKYGPANFYQHMGTAIPERNYHPSSPYAAQGKAIADMQDFRMRFPTPEMQKAAIESVNGYAGGGLRKSIQEMAEELMKKGVKTTDKPDLSRRSLFGMGEIKAPTQYPIDLAKQLNDEVMNFGNAPKVVQKTTEVVPGGKKSTIESLAETPVSRRQILKSTASQAGQAMLPQSLIHEATNLVPKVAEPLGPLQSSVPMASQMSVHEMLPGIIARGIDKGLNDQELVDYVLKHTNNHPEVEDQLVDNLATQITNPESEQEHEFDISRPGQALIDILDPQGGIYTDSVYRLRPTLRYLKSQSPEIYQDTLNNARDISMGHIENLYEHHDVDPDLLKAWQEGKIDSWELAKQHFGETD